ncbi:hypothetical protein F2Q70_00018149 [Brassica cretica]|uniref:Uncharacterized protein n=1 Tax=Brassica cretica TaxID=69181 RepID=A0A8S9HRN6_BRACR|nr:hypothetical protein F2Q70_00018149 [Brassica cretica]
MIQESLQLATVEPSTRQTTQRQSRLTQKHQSTVAIRNQPTHYMKNRSIVIQMIGRTTTTTPLLPHIPDNTCIQKSMMKTMQMNELLSTKPSLMRRIHFYIIPLGKGMHHRSTYLAHHRSILNLLRKTGNEHRPTSPTTHRYQLANYLHGGDEARHSQNSTCYRRCSIVIDRLRSTYID